MSLFVTNIQRMSLHDGPGIRTTVFLKGCSLRCFWCHNPETLRVHNELRYISSRCIHCGLCASACPETTAQSPAQLVGYVQQTPSCASCFRCAQACPAEALVPAAYLYGEEALLEQLLADREYYRSSGGGVTFSGGEPLLQAKDLLPVLKRLKTLGIHTAIDTAGNVPWEAFQTVLEAAQLFLFDVKAASSQLHQRVTGSSNRRILENLGQLCAAGAAVQIRIPLIPGVNMSPQELDKIADILKAYPQLKGVDLLPFHRMALSKYQQLGLAYPAQELETSTADQLHQAMDRLASSLTVPVRCRALENT